MGGSNAKADCLLSLWLLGCVLWEHVFGAVNVFDEFEVVDLVVVAAVAVLANDEVVDLGVGGHEVEGFEHAQELALRNVQLLGTVEVLEAVLKQDSVRNNLLIEPLHYLQHLHSLFI